MTEIDDTTVLDAVERISRYSKYLYEGTSQDHSKDELQMMIDTALVEILETVGLEEREIYPRELKPIEKSQIIMLLKNHSIGKSQGDLKIIYIDMKKNTA